MSVRPPIQTSASIELLHDGRVAPLTFLDFAREGQKGVFDGGVYYSNGEVCHRGIQIKGAYKNQPAALADDAFDQRVQGKHLFCGMLQNGHFGYCMAESLSRLWATEHLNGRLDSLVFYLRTPGRPVARFAQEVLGLLVPELPVRIVSTPTIFEILAVPEQLGDLNQGFIFGHPENRSLFSRLRSIGGDGPRKVYVSRSRLKPHEGGVLLEALIEDNMRREGYAVIHPQELSIRDQLAVYNSARDLVFAEGSALHLYALVARPNQQTFVVWRRKKNNTFGWQLKTFDGPLVQGAPCIKKTYIPKTDFGAMVRARAVLDFQELREQLVASSFINGSTWQNPTDSDFEQELTRIQSMVKQQFVEHLAL